VIVGDLAFVGSEDGRLYALDVGSGQSVWEYEAGGGFVGGPAVAAGRLIIGNTDGVLYCFGADPGSGGP
jgi:outer membrane protein assembly factor BamB